MKKKFSDSINNEIYDYFIKDFYYKMITNYRKKIYKFDTKTSSEFKKQVFQNKRIKQISIQKLRSVIFNDFLDVNILEDIRRKMKDIIEKSASNISAEITLKVINKNDVLFYYEVEFIFLNIPKVEIQDEVIEELDVMEPYTIPEDILKFYIENPYENNKDNEIKLNFIEEFHC